MNMFNHVYILSEQIWGHENICTKLFCKLGKLSTGLYFPYFSVYLTIFLLLQNFHRIMILVQIHIDLHKNLGLLDHTFLMAHFMVAVAINHIEEGQMDISIMEEVVEDNATEVDIFIHIPTPILIRIPTLILILIRIPILS